MPEPVTHEVVHYREFIRTLTRTRAICHVCKVSWPCRTFLGGLKANAWWYVSQQPEKVKPDPEV